MYCILSKKFRLQNTPVPKAQGTMQKRVWWKDYKSQRLRKIVRLYLLVMSAVTPIKSHQYDFLNMSWTRMTPMDRLKWTEKSPLCLKSMQRTTGTWGKLGARDVIFLSEEHTNQLPSAKWSALKRYILNRLYLRIYCVYIYMQ